MRTFLIRLAVAAVAIPAVLWIFYQGGWWLRGFVLILAALGCYEAARLAQLAQHSANSILAFATAVLVLLSITPEYAITIGALYLSIVFVLSGVAAVWRGDPNRVFESVIWSVSIGIWVGFGFGSLEALRWFSSDEGFRLLLFLFANLWAGDTVAYIVGAWLGKRPLAPSISPKKTIAGAVAQIITSLAVSALFSIMGWLSQPLVFALSAGFVIAVVGQVGDLFESCLKRMAGEKDSSSILPGHGGVLDRFDSTLFAAPALWVIFMIWG